MRRRVIRAFDDYIAPGATVMSSNALNEILGEGDQLSLHAIIDNIIVAGTFDCFLEHSSDGRNWIQRNGAASTAGNGDISVATISVGSGYSKMWSDGAIGTTNATGPILPFVRLRIQLGAGSAHVAVHASLRALG